MDGKPIQLVPVLFEPFLEQTQLLIQRAYEGLEIQEIKDSTEELSTNFADFSASSVDRYEDYLRDTTMEELWGRLYGSPDDIRKYVLLKNLTEILLPMHKIDSSRISLGLRFPISPDRNCLAYDTSFWLDVSMSFLENPPLSPVFFWTVPDEREHPFHLFLFFRTPSPKHLAHLLDVDLKSDNICDLDEDGKENEADMMQAIPPYHRTLFEREDLTLSNFLRQLGMYQTV
jgi:hypothetical protein